MERNEREEAAKAQLQLIERIPQQEWLIYGFPIGHTEVSEAEAGGFIAAIVHARHEEGQAPSGRLKNWQGTNAKDGRLL
jgi:hypothetical protein